MRLVRLARAFPLCALLLLAPSPVLADHCGGGATIAPASGPPGTTFVFEMNLGARSDLHLYRDGKLVESVFLEDTDDVRYSIRTGPGDAGAWRARAEVRDQTECAAEATFTVVEAPDTSTAPETPGGPPVWILFAAAGAAALLVGLWRFAVRSGGAGGSQAAR